MFPFRRKLLTPRFSLRTFLIVVAVVGILCGWLGLAARRALNQRYAVNRVNELIVSVKDTSVTKEGVERLQKVVPNCSIQWGTETYPRIAVGDASF